MTPDDPTPPPEPPSHALMLRRLAEKADGLRDQDLALVQRADGTLDVVPVDEVGTQPVLYQLRTPSQHPADQRPKFELVLTPPPPGVPFDARARYDALFWTESAVEKFLLPYYQRVLTPEELLELARAFRDNPNVYAVGHWPPTRYELLSTDGPSPGL